MSLIERSDLFQLFWIPAAVSVGLLVLFWARGALPKHAFTLAGWWLVGVTLQVSATTPIVWVAGLLLQTALALLLLITFRLEGL